MWYVVDTRAQSLPYKSNWAVGGMLNGTQMIHVHQQTDRHGQLYELIQAT